MFGGFEFGWEMTTTRRARIGGCAFGGFEHFASISRVEHGINLVSAQARIRPRGIHLTPRVRVLG